MKSIFKFGRRHFTDFKTFDDVCRANGTTEDEFNERFGDIGLSNYTINYEKIKLIVRAINQGWVPDWNNIQQRKSFPWFDVSSSGFGFSYSHSFYEYTYALVGSRLYFESEEKCEYAAKQFIEIYKQFLL